MTTTTTLAVLHEACSRTGLDASDAVPLHQHAATVYLFETERIVVRLNRDGDDRRRARTVVELTRWLTQQDFPSVAPADVEQPLDVDDYTVTLWRYYPQNDRPNPTANHLGVMLRQLHALPTPPVELSPYQPLKNLGDAVVTSTSLSARDREWLLTRRTELLGEYERLDFPLGYGWIHGDAYPGNTLWDGDRTLLADWDEVGTGPRELDLVNTHQGVRFGRPQAERDAFTAAYGYDVTAWPGFPVLRKMRDLHTLGSYIRLADAGNERAAIELGFRLDTLKRGDADAHWNAR
jgi:aminoglycoside phosphotransferase (APT) family kinase protein